LDTQTITKIVDFITSLQSILDQVSRYPIIHYTANFIISWVASYVSINILFFGSDINTYEKLLQFVSTQKGQDKEAKWIIKYYKLCFATVTAIAATALIEIQFYSINIAFSAIYGLMGPYSLRAKIQSIIGEKTSRVSQAAFQVVAHEVPEIKASSEKEIYESDIDKIRETWKDDS
jgi:hypothetical protein